jgi:hypothetical protein
MTVRPSKGIEYVLAEIPPAADDPRHGENAKLGGGSQRDAEGQEGHSAAVNRGYSRSKATEDPCRPNGAGTARAMGCRRCWSQLRWLPLRCEGRMLNALHDPGDRKALSRHCTRLQALQASARLLAGARLPTIWSRLLRRDRPRRLAELRRRARRPGDDSAGPDPGDHSEHSADAGEAGRIMTGKSAKRAGRKLPAN